ncbi:MAG: polysaccharide biosynthesis/export family protein [Thermodesulfobacteriota bacterium]|nr:polysaccharide biosynthesis/export family protein [Thermodesulfobacteriota bacterium]
MRVHKINLLWRFLCVVLVFAVTSVGGTVFASQSFLEPGEAYLVGLGDVLEIQVWNEADLSRTVNVRLDGVISLPLVGDVTVVGKPIPEITQVLEKRYSDLIEEPTVTVILTESRSRKYYLIGQVAQPGEFPLDSPISLLQAIARGGGFSEWAKKDRVGVVRRQSGKDSILKFNYETFVKGENLQQNFLIEPGDTIVVP